MKNILNALISKIVGLLIITFLATLSYGNQSEIKEQKAPQKLPNIVLIFADDMRYGDIQKYNPASKIPTPNLNSLAENDICFKDAHINSAVCSPSRFGILTGRYTWGICLKPEYCRTPTTINH